MPTTNLFNHPDFTLAEFAALDKKPMAAIENSYGATPLEQCLLMMRAQELGYAYLYNKRAGLTTAGKKARSTLQLLNTLMKLSSCGPNDRGLSLIQNICSIHNITKIGDSSDDLTRLTEIFLELCEQWPEYNVHPIPWPYFNDGWSYPGEWDSETERGKAQLRMIRWIIAEIEKQ